VCAVHGGRGVTSIGAAMFVFDTKDEDDAGGARTV
jgi:hypothetical protein